MFLNALPHKEWSGINRVFYVTFEIKIELSCFNFNVHLILSISCNLLIMIITSNNQILVLYICFYRYIVRSIKITKYESFQWWSCLTQSVLRVLLLDVCFITILMIMLVIKYFKMMLVIMFWSGEFMWCIFDYIYRYTRSNHFVTFLTIYVDYVCLCNHHHVLHQLLHQNEYRHFLTE